MRTLIQRFFGRAYSSLTEGFPPIKGVNWFNLAIVVVTPIIAFCGLASVAICRNTAVFSIFWFIFSMIGITAGYHRLWSHRSYNAAFPLQCFLMFGATSCVVGSCFWWSRRHRSHHRHTDTDSDPYNAQRGLLWTHIGWILFKTDLQTGPCDVSDLRNDPLVQFQHRRYFPLAILLGYILPAVIPGVLWGDWKGGFYFAAALRMTIAHHSIFSINSIAHHLGSKPYDDKLTPRDHLFSAILTMGEGYHNFHHQFPMDYRNAFLWYQYDPTKWFIAACAIFGLASNLRIFPRNEILKGAFTMKMKTLFRLQQDIQWPISRPDLPVVDWETFQSAAKDQTLILVSGFIHDVGAFLDTHPGGRAVLAHNSGKDMTAAFFGGVYEHSNAAHNLLAMMRVAALVGGVEIVENGIPPSQALYIATRQAAIVEKTSLL